MRVSTHACECACVRVSVRACKCAHVSVRACESAHGWLCVRECMRVNVSVRPKKKRLHAGDQPLCDVIRICVFSLLSKHFVHWKNKSFTLLSCVKQRALPAGPFLPLFLLCASDETHGEHVRKNGPALLCEVPSGRSTMR